MKTAEERFNEYLKRWAESRGVEPEDLKDLAIIKEYKDWIIKECKDYDYSREKELSEAIQEINSEDKCSGKGTSRY